METAPILRARNATFVDGFSAGDLPLPPRLDLVVVSCFDPRVDPGTYWGLGLGDAFVIRSVGGRVTDQVIMSVGMIHSLVRSVQGRSVPLEVAVVHHTECGAVRLADPAVRAELSATLAVEASVLEALAATDPRESVVIDVERVRAAEVLADDLSVSGHVYDLRTGAIDEVVPTQPIRS